MITKDIDQPDNQKTDFFLFLLEKKTLIDAVLVAGFFKPSSFFSPRHVIDLRSKGNLTSKEKQKIVLSFASLF